MSSEAGASQVPSARQRPKPRLSCNICRLRKVKCDRKNPCSQCISHGHAQLCEYLTGGAAKQQQNLEQTHVISKLNHLESLVHSMMSERQTTNATHSPGPPSIQPTLPRNPSTEHELPTNFGRLALDNIETSYVGSDHWASIIDGIAELKNHFEEEEQPAVIPELAPSICGEDGPEIFHGHIRSISRQEIIAALPSKDVVDGLVSTYFNQHDQIPIFLHTPTFLKEYDRFWSNMNNAPIMWIGLLFCIMCIGARFQSSYESPDYGSPDDLLMSNALWKMQEYREKTVQSLLAGNYTKPGRYTVETLLLYFMCEHLHHADAQFGNWILMGQITRIAMRLGLHRDPSHTSQISPFHGEMRRRLWTAIVQVDLTTSCQMGLPKMIQESYCDTREPSNYTDEDLDECLTELPKPRPISVLTPILYICTRNGLLSVFAKIADISTSVKGNSYGVIEELDKELLEARAAIPAGLQLQAMSPSTADRPDILIHRIFLDTVYQHARCMLHRKYLIPARTSEQYAKSKTYCIEAAVSLLHHQQNFDRDARPGGQFQTCRWKLSSFWNHGMLYAATVLCADLYQDLEDGLVNEDYWDKGNRREIAEILRSAQQILWQSYNISADSRKGATAINVVLSKAGLLNDRMDHDDTGSGDPFQQFIPTTPSWSLEEFLGSGFPNAPVWTTGWSPGRDVNLGVTQDETQFYQYP